ncbi:MAG: hypothetical protein HC794_09745 [Nitrospiraceae bacterium]|nr:hypothetical protein [Nitrospiraceae bacterium]
MSDDIETMNELEEEAGEEGEDSATIEITQEMIDAEIAELEGYLSIANSIAKNAKGEELLKRLPRVLDEIEGKGGARKAVIFTGKACALSCTSESFLSSMATSGVWCS